MSQVFHYIQIFNIQLEIYNILEFKNKYFSFFYSAKKTSKWTHLAHRLMGH